MVVRPNASRRLVVPGLAVLLNLALVASCSSDSDLAATGPDAAISEPAAGVWHAVFDDLSSLVLAGWAASADDAFFVGGDGLVLRYQQSRWYQLAVPTRANLWWVWGTSPRDVYVGGEEGTLLHFDGGSWRSIETPLDDAQTIWGIWGATDDDLWLVGGNARTNGPGFVLRGNRTRLDVQDLGETLPNLFKVWGPTQDEVLLVGDEGVVVSIQGGAVEIQHLAPDHGGSRVEALFTVAGNGEGSVFAVGGVTSGMVFEQRGSTWEFHDLETQGLNGVAVSESGDAYVVGLAGAIRRRHDGRWLNEDYAPERHYHSAVLMGDVVFAVGGDLLSPPAERRGLLVARGAVSAGPITQVPGDDGGTLAGPLDAAIPILDSGPEDAAPPSDGDDGGGPAGSLDSGVLPDADAPDSSIEPPLPGPPEMCTAELECAAGAECWYVQGESEDRCVTPCETADQCPAATYGANPQCASPGCQTLYTVCMPASWVGCF